MNALEAVQLTRELLDKNGLQNVNVELNGRMTRAFGQYEWSTLYNRKVIKLSSKLIAINDRERVFKTIAHEVAHALTEGEGHNHIWRAKCIELGGDGRATYSRVDTNIVEPRNQYYMLCDKCGHDFNGAVVTRRKRNLMHSVCWGDIIYKEKG